jgi:glucose dehydrogenase
MSVINLKTRELVWQRPLGTTKDNAPFGIAMPGAFTQAGSILTKGGLIFVGATQDSYLRAFDVATGEELWKGRLPAGGQATPMSFVSEEDAKQYVVIAAGGHQYMQTQMGDYLVAYRLPN